MKNNKLRALLVSSAIFTGAILDSSIMALAEDTTTNPEIPKDNGAVAQQLNEKSTPVINGIKVNKQLIDINYSKGVTISPKYIVIHDTDNRSPGANAMANRNYFANHPNANASAHYIIDDSNIVQALEDTWKGWHVGDGGSGAAVQNGNSIGIELAVNKGNNFDKTHKTGIALTRYLMNKYNIPAQNVVMHNHASGKICSRMMIQDRPNMWEEFKSAAAVGIPGESLINDGIKPTAKGKLVNVSSYLNVRTQPNSFSPVLGNVYPNKIMNIYGEENGYYKVDFMGTRKTYGYVSKEYINIINGDIEIPDVETPDVETPGDIQLVPVNKDGVVTNLGSVSALNVRTGPSTSHNIQDKLPANTKVRVDSKTTTGWYKISYSNGKTGYVSDDYIKLIEDENTGGGNESDKVQINKDGVVINISEGSALNVRAGAGTNHTVKDRIAGNIKVKVNYETAGWYNISYGNGKTGYVSKNYIKLIEGGNTEAESGLTPVNKNGVVTNLGSVSALNVRTGPSTSHSIQDKLPANTKVRVDSKTTTGWYKISYSNGKTGYVSDDYIKFIEDENTGGGNESDKVQINKDGVVINISEGSTLNVRAGAGTGHTVKDRIAGNTKVKVNYETAGWYNISYGSGKTGYVSKDYIKIVESNNNGSENPDVGSTTQVNKDGIVANLGSVSALNVRTGPGTNNSIKDKLPLNTKVRVNYKTQTGWYNISYSGKTGFVSSDYIKIVENGGTTTPDTGNINKNGTVINVTTSLNVRTGPSTSYSITDKIPSGKIVKVNYEKNGWYNISYDGKLGYVSKEYIKLSGSGSGSVEGGNGGTTTPESNKKTGTVINVTNTLNVRSGAGTSYSKIGTLNANAKVTINYEKDGWYNINFNGSTGFVSKEYIKVDGNSTSKPETTQQKGKVINVTTNLNVRAGRGTGYSIVGYVLGGDVVTVLDHKEGWHKIEYTTESGTKTGYVKDEFIKIL